jgi:hypothetical protein
LCSGALIGRSTAKQQRRKPISAGLLLSMQALIEEKYNINFVGQQ